MNLQDKQPMVRTEQPVFMRIFNRLQEACSFNRSQVDTVRVLVTNLNGFPEYEKAMNEMKKEERAIDGSRPPEKESMSLALIQYTQTLEEANALLSLIIENLISTLGDPRQEEFIS